MKNVEILVVEDSLTQAEQLKHIIERHGYQVTLAQNGQQALDLTKKCKPALVISDIVMPVMDGYQLCCEIKSDDDLKEVPVLLLTSLSDPKDIIRGLKCGADNFITKPFNEEMLISRIQYMLINKDLRKSGRMHIGVEMIFGDETYLVTPERQQILDMLISSYEVAVQKNRELIDAQNELRELNESLEDKIEERTTELRAEIAERNRAEEALRISEERYRYLFENNPLSMWIYDIETLRFLSVNYATINHYGYSREEFLALTIEDIRPPEDLPVLLKNASEIEAAIGKVYVFKHQKKDGSIIDVEVTSHELIFDNRPARLVLANDITERNQAEEALRLTEEQLRQSQKLEAIGQLAGGIAHDFNNMLTAINGYSELSLMRLESEDPLRRNLEEIKKAGERAAGLTGQLLAFSRKQVLQPKIININSTISDFEKMLQRLIGEDVGLMTMLEPEIGSVKADPGQIEQVIMNLVINARDAMPQGGKLSIETNNIYLDENYAGRHAGVTPGFYVMLAVSDTGTGIDEETRKRVFEPFFTTKELGKGTGLGLSTVYGIVKQSGGNIWIYSEPGVGTTFKIYLPRVDENADNYEQSDQFEANIQGTETILLAEDEEIVRNLARAVLESYGYQVLEAINGSSALLICEQHEEPIHLLVTDVVMPEMGGRELAERLIHLRPEMKVLYMSGYTDNAIVHHGVLEERTKFIQKPFAPDALVQKIREVLSEQ